MRAWIAGLGLATALLAGACSASGAASQASTARELATVAQATTVPSAPVELVVYGAASLKGVLAEVETTYEAAHPGLAVTVSTDNSAALATQIEQGAPADVFLSADTTNPARLVDAGLAAGRPVPFARNELAVIIPADNPAGLAAVEDLGRPGVKIIAAGEDVPITGYATRLVANLAGEPGSPAGFGAAYEANVVSREDNVKAVVAKIELGEGDAAIVYATDAQASDRVTTLEIPPGANVAATYDGLVVASSAHPAEAAAFLRWFAGPGGAAILARAGFLPVP